VKIVLEGASDLVPGSGKALEPSKVLEKLNARLSKRAVVVGRIEYPEAFSVPTEGAPSSRGMLVVAKAVLTPETPYELLSYALEETAFPRQSTGDQFFDHAQFDA
jgi:hypothetical protein